MKQRARRKIERPGEILAAAFDTFAERGFSATRIEDIAALAGVSKGTIYHYFETKERLFEKMVRHYAHAVLADAATMLASMQGTYSEKLRAFIIFVYGRCVRDRTGREMIRLMVAEGKCFPRLVEHYYGEFFDLLVQVVGDLLAAGAAAGEFRPDIAEKSPEVILAPAFFLSLLRLIFANKREVDEEACISAHIDLIFNGLLMPSAPKLTHPIHAS
jgi:AcrR family transcriptional regulator